jgi:dTDP-glucose pyrophosphorylase
MNNYKGHTINENASVLEAMIKINGIRNLALTLFVCDNDKKLVGSLTDGDIRRGLVNGMNPEMPVNKFMLKSFKFIKDNCIDVNEIVNIRNKGIQLLPMLNNEGQIVKIHNFLEKKSLLPLECIIMAGGRGERLKPLTDDTPKPMLKLGGKPIIEHNIDRLIEYGIEKIHISINYLGHQIQHYFGNGEEKGIQIEYITEDKPLGTAGALSLIDEVSTENVLLMNSDLFTNVNFENLFLETINNNADMGIATIPYTVNIPYAIFKQSKNIIKSFKEKPNHTHYANAGIYIFKKEWISRIPKDTTYNTTDLIELMLNENKKIIHDPILGYWIDIGKREDYIRAKEFAKHMS